MEPPLRVRGNIRGIDVSKFQGRIDWPRLYREAGPGTEHNICTVSIRCGESLYATPDDEWERNWKGAHDAGFEYVDAYHVPHASVPAIQQAELFAERVTRLGRLGDYDSVSDDFEVFDLPQSGKYGKLVHEHNVLFVDSVEHFLGRQMKVYTGVGFVQLLRRFGAPDVSPLGQRPLWVAHYGVDWPLIPPWWDKFLFWQWLADGSGSEPGIPAGDHIDHDVFFSGDEKVLRRYFASAHLLAPTPETAPGKVVEDGSVILSSEGASDNAYEPHLSNDTDSK